VNGAEEEGCHPDSSDWKPLFGEDLASADYNKSVWTVSNCVLTASKDKLIWTEDAYDDFILDLQFKTGKNANSGVIVYCSDTGKWIPHSVEVQILDDYGEKWAEVADTWRCGGIFGHLAPAKRMVKKSGNWNRMTIKCVGPQIDVFLNGEQTVSMDMDRWTSSKKNPDGSDIPGWLSKPLADLPTKGKIGLQGKHGGAPIWFRNIKIKELE